MQYREFTFVRQQKLFKSLRWLWHTVVNLINTILIGQKEQMNCVLCGFHLNKMCLNVIKWEVVWYHTITPSHRFIALYYSKLIWKECQNVEILLLVTATLFISSFKETYSRCQIKVLFRHIRKYLNQPWEVSKILKNIGICVFIFT